MSALARFATFTLALAIGTAGVGCGELADDVFCADGDCQFTRAEWRRVESLANPGEPELDTSNKYLVGPKAEAAVALGHLLYWEKGLSGLAKWEDTLGRPTTSARAPRGQPIKTSCADCHDPRRGGGDLTSTPQHVSEGAGWYDVNGQQTLNSAFYKLLYWNGRSDSLWMQAAQVMESDVSMNGNRLEIVRFVAENYRAEYTAVFDEPLPPFIPRAELAARVKTSDVEGDTCIGGTVDACPADCRPVGAVCAPRFPLKGEPRDGKCTLGMGPYGDNFDCMEVADQALITRHFVNVAKAIAAYEWRLRSRDSAFDRFVNGDRAKLSGAAVRGLKLFIGRASCIDCHSTPLLSDGAFHNIGVPQRGVAVPTADECPADGIGSMSDGLLGASCSAWGYFTGLLKLRAIRPDNPNSLRRDGPHSDDPAGGTASHGAFYNAMPGSVDVAAWRTPSLRDVARTAPYMHTGLYRTLEEVIWHYDVGGGEIDNRFARKAVELKPLFLSARDRADLVEFLKTLDGSLESVTPEERKLYLPPLRTVVP